MFEGVNPIYFSNAFIFVVLKFPKFNYKKLSLIIP